MIHEVIVSLILHVNDYEEETREASRESLIKIFNFTQKKPLLKISTDFLEDQACKRFIYSEFVKDFAHVQDDNFNEMFPRYVDKAMAYFMHTDPVLRANAVIFVTALLVEGSHSTLHHVNHEMICKNLSKLLNDSCLDVKMTAASNLGKVCIALSNPPKPRLSLAQSESNDN